MTPDAALAQFEPLCHWCVRKFVHLTDRDADYEDLVQEARKTLVRAARHWDPTKGVRFQTYATIAIRRQIVYADLVRRRFGFSHCGERAVIVAESVRKPRSLYTHRDGTEWAGNIAEPTLDESVSDATDEVTALLDTLPTRWRRAVVGRYFEERRLDDIAAELHVSKERARQLVEAGLRRIRETIGAKP